ncbi:uncharacterized protein [Clytia hemisphaerica]|uniref:MAM domain-containing protein n=1 Tax=Clytia hemisphaerica TaxID=252671 RepID=A0A7M5UF65_9CNID|eukprot:TCONS_00047672-protein
MRFLLSNFLTLLLLTYSAGLSTSKIEKIEDNLDILQDDIESLLEKESRKNDESAANTIEQFEPLSTIAKRQNGGSGDYHCSFDGDCMSDFEVKNTQSIIWKRKIHHGHIMDRANAGSGFMFAELRYLKDKTEKAHFNTGSFPVPENQSCASFYYYMYGNQWQCDISRFLVYMECEGDNEPTELFRTSGNNYEDRKWRRVRIDVNKAKGTQCKVFWRVSKGLSHTHAYIAVDDIKWATGACPTEGGPEKPEYADCSFDSVNACEWKVSGAVPPSFSGWSTHQRGRTGPDTYFGYRSYPHGTRGHYVYLDSRHTQYARKSLKLQSPLLRSTGKKCLKFALSMYGQTMGSVEAFVESTDGSKQKVFSKVGHQQGKTYKWFDNAVTLPENKDYKIDLVATVGNGTKSDIAIDNILVADGECPSGDIVLASCSFGDSGECAYTNDVCPTNESKEFKKPEVFKPYRNSPPLTKIQKLAKEWSVSFEIKMLGTIRGWTNIIHFTTGGNHGHRGTRIPAVFVWSNTYKLHITSAVGWHGNYQFNKVVLRKDKWTKLEISMKKDTDGKYYYRVLVDDVEKHKAHNSLPTEYKGVEVYAGDEWYPSTNAELKNFVFQNGELEPCNPVCNHNVNDPLFVPAPPAKQTFAAEQQVTRSKLLTTLPELTKEWKVSMDVKLKSKKGGWTNIIHATTGHNCCHRGQRVPAIFVFSNQYRSHICSPLGGYGNHNYNDIYFPQNQYTNVVMQQKKFNGQYRYQIFQNNAIRHNVTQTKPEVFKNVKYYISDPWHNAADADVKNIVIENLVSTYPCPNMCKGRKNKETINGTEVNTFTYDTETCENLPVRAQVNVPKHLRYGCARMMFKLGYAAKNYCVVRFYNGGRHLHHFRNIKSGWNKVQFDLFENGSRVGLTVDKIYSYCPMITVTDIQVTEGMC